MATQSSQPAASTSADLLDTQKIKAANPSKKASHKIKTVSMFVSALC
jgi:hypothetical protein